MQPCTPLLLAQSSPWADIHPAAVLRVRPQARDPGPRSAHPGGLWLTGSVPVTPGGRHPARPFTQRCAHSVPRDFGGTLPIYPTCCHCHIPLDGPYKELVPAPWDVTQRHFCILFLNGLPPSLLLETGVLGCEVVRGLT